MSNNTSNITNKSETRFKLESIDAIRGIAILLVIISHTSALLKELPWPVKKLTNMGWHGVQLFFIASAFTLLLSWNHQLDASHSNKTIKFFIRRLMRIAPMYYVGIILYFIIRPPAEAFNTQQLVLNAFFLNAWSPITMTTVNNHWQVVPGGWSIGVEFSFYFIFPLLTLFVTTLRKSLCFLFFSFILSLFSFILGKQFYAHSFNEQEVDNFLFFWLPNQIFVFGLGFLIYFVYSSNSPRIIRMKHLIGTNDILIILSVISIFVFISQIGISKHFSANFPWIPLHYAVSCLFFILFISIIEGNRNSIFKRWLINLGKVSFSAYIIHFAIIQAFHFEELDTFKGLSSVFLFFGLLLCIVLVTHGISFLSFKIIEEPFIARARKICAKF